MVRLTTPDDECTKFFFNTMEDCNAFIEVFKNHFCNVAWNEPEEADDFEEAHTTYWEEHINDDPEKLADGNLDWGFAIDKLLNRGLTPDQQKFVDDLANKITEGK